MAIDPVQFGKGETARQGDFLQPKAWQHSEISGAFSPPVWTEKDQSSGFMTYPKRSQGGQSSCTSYAMAKALSVDELSENGSYRELSPRSLYPYTFISGGGASSLNVAQKAVKIGMTLESLLPSDGLSEAAAESDSGYAADAKQVALIYKPSSFVESTSDFETIASIIQGYAGQGQKKVVMISVVGQNNGTWLSPFPKPAGDLSLASWYHRLCVTDFGLIAGKKVLAVDNSMGGGLQQFLTEDHASFMYGAIYTLNQRDNWQQLQASAVPMISYSWRADLSLGSSGPDVTALQIALQSMGMFPVLTLVKPTGYFGGITRAAVNLFQAAMALPVTGAADPQTREKLNGIFK